MRGRSQTLCAIAVSWMCIAHARISMAQTAESSAPPVEASASGAPEVQLAPMVMAPPISQQPTPAASMPAPAGPMRSRGAPPMHARRGLFAAGSAILAGVYLLSLIPAVAASTGTSALPSDAFLYLPLAGPFIVACDTNVGSGDRVWLLVDGFFQLSGAAMILLSELLRVPDYEPQWGSARRTGVRRWSLAPVAPGATVGASWSAELF